MYRTYLGPLLIALTALVATTVTLAPEGLGPGVTCDELYHVNRGKDLVTSLRHQGLAFFLASNIDRNFGWKPGDAPVQAPLGYWILGAVHHFFDAAPDNPAALSIYAARFAPAIAFGLLVAWVGVWLTRRDGQLAGTVAAMAVVLMPRVFAHAHFASLDMLTTLFFVATVLAAADAVRDGRTRWFVLAGILWGATILVRLHGLLAAPPIVLWMVWQLRTKAIRPLTAWLASGVATVFLGWPWLWLAPIQHFRYFLSSGTARDPLHVFYLGQVWADRDVPWHYPWTMFAVTVPLGLLALGLYGAWAKCRAESDGGAQVGIDRKSNAIVPECRLLVGTILFLLFVFSWPGTPVYDGERLFLMAFPLWAILVGIGAKQAVQVLAARFPKWVCYSGLTIFLALQSIGLAVYYPCHLCYYNLLVGGLAGANRLGFETTYWGDTVREPMLAKAVELSHGQPILFAPSLAPFQLVGIQFSSPALHETQTELLGWEANSPRRRGCSYAIVYNRRADLAPAESLLASGRVVMCYESQGVWLAKLLELPPIP